MNILHPARKGYLSTAAKLLPGDNHAMEVPEISASSFQWRAHCYGFAAPSVPYCPRPKRTKTPLHPIRVGLISPNWHIGGVGRWFYALAKFRDQNKTEWTGVALTENSYHPDGLTELGQWAPYGIGPLAVAALRETCDVLVVWATPEVGPMLLGYTGRVVLVSHGGGNWTRVMLAKQSGFATDFVAVSKLAADQFHPSLRDRVRVIPCGVETDRCKPHVGREKTRQSWGVSKHIPVLGYLGRYSPEKNFLAAARAASYHGCHAAYLGCGPETALQSIRAEYNEVTLLPHDYHVGDFLAGIDVLIHVSDEEGASITFLEGALAKVPMICTYTGSVPEAEQDFGPIVWRVDFRPGVDEICDQLQTILQDPSRNQKLNHGYHYARQHTAQNMATRWDMFFQGEL